MYYIENERFGCRFGQSQQNTMKTQEVKEARGRLAEEFVALLRLSPDDGVHWTGSVRDLMEAAHVVYTDGTVCDGEGCVCTFRALAARACTVLHVTLPRNPSAVAYQGEQRKGVRRGPFIQRYAAQMFRMGIERPLERMVTGKHTSQCSPA